MRNSESSRRARARVSEVANLMVTHFTEKQFSVCFGIFEALQVLRDTRVPTDKRLMTTYQLDEDAVAILIHVDGDGEQTFKSVDTLIEIDTEGEVSVWIEAVREKSPDCVLRFHVLNAVTDTPSLLNVRASSWLQGESYFQKWAKSLFEAFGVGIGDTMATLEDNSQVRVPFAEFFR